METLVTKDQVATAGIQVVETHDPGNDLFTKTGHDVIYAVFEDEDRPLILVFDDLHEINEVKRHFGDKVRFYRMKRSDYQRLRNEAIKSSGVDG